MLKQATANFYPFQFGEDALAASRKVWLASLGAAAVTRDWVQSEATRTFKTLVKEGTVVESRAVSFVGERIELSMSRANRLWKRARSTVESTVRGAAHTAVTMTNNALPKSLPRIELPIAAKPQRAKRPAAKAAPAKKPVRKSAAKVARRAKRAAAQ
jgi:hypothetical protein